MEKLETVLLILGVLFIAVCIGGMRGPSENEKLLDKMNKLKEKEDERNR